LNRDEAKQAISTLSLASYTAIGEAIFTSLDTIKAFGKAEAGKGSKPPPARIVLLSDGGNTYGRTVESAIAAARSAHVQVSTIAFGTPNGTVSQDGRVQAVPADDNALRGIAQQTGGSFHTATSEQELKSVYRDIGSQIGYTTTHRDISYRFLLIGVLFLFAAAGTSMLWAGRLI
jgi:Ca-activated chloride channel family protein